MTSKSDDSGMPHRYSADRPLDRLADDQLDRADFAERLAADVIGWHGKDSLVVSVNGEWGSGKTTLKNFICEKLEAKGKPIIVEFNPWAWSGQDKLAEGFFSSLHSKFRESPDMEAMAERWEKLEHWMKFGAEVSETVSKALTPLFGGSVIVALLSNSASDPRLQLGGVSLGIAGVVITSSLTAFPGIVPQLAAFFRRKASPSLAKLRREITKDLSRLREEKRPVVVIIDDIDRLNAEEIRFLFQLVKVNADFPNLVYVLLFQANIVTKALSEVSADSGEEYLKKIVQVPMDLPHASRARMQAILIRGLNQIIDDEKVKLRWDKKRYLDLFEDYLWPYFNTLRDVKRFLGTFDFHYHGQIDNGVLQVNPVDLLAIEILRTFDHDAYLAVRDSLGFNLPKKFMRLLIGDSERRKEITVEIDAIAAQVADKAQQDRLRHILKALFPDTFGEEERSHAERDLRICHPDHFPRYFEHSPDRKPTSASNLHSLFGVLSDRTKFAQRLRELNAEKQIEAILGKISLYFEEIPSNAGEGFVGGLFDAGDEFPEASLGMFNQSPDLMAGRMVGVFLRKLPDSTSRAKLLEKCLAATPGHVVPTIVLTLLTAFAVKKGGEAPIAEADLAPLRALVLGRIKQLAASGAIWGHRQFDLFLYRWRDWVSQEEVNTWLQSALDSPARKAEFVGHMTQYSVVNGSRIEHYLNGSLLEKFSPIEQLAADIAGIPERNLTKHQVLARKLLGRAVKLKAQGHGYAEVRERGDFEPGSDDE